MGGLGPCCFLSKNVVNTDISASTPQGLRTFLESEVTKSSRRMDLLAKMVDLAPDEPTAEEKEKGITKLRYMMFRERLSSTNTLGFRIEAIKVGRGQIDQC